MQSWKSVPKIPIAIKTSKELQKYDAEILGNIFELVAGGMQKITQKYTENHPKSAPKVTLNGSWAHLETHWATKLPQDLHFSCFWLHFELHLGTLGNPWVSLWPPFSQMWHL